MVGTKEEIENINVIHTITKIVCSSSFTENENKTIQDRE